MTHTAPSSCFLNPIEEHFAQVEAQFQRLYDEEVLKYDQYVVPRANVRRLVSRAVRIVGVRDCRDIFARAGLI